MILIWPNQSSPGEFTYVSAEYDVKPYVKEYQGLKYAVINFHPITDARHTVAMREPLDSTSGSLIVVQCDEDTFIPVHEVDRIYPASNPEEIFSAKPFANSEQTIHDLALEKELEGQIYLDTPPLNTHPVSPEPKETRYFASNLGMRSRTGQQGFLILEVPVDRGALSTGAMDSDLDDILESARRSRMKSDPMPAKTDLYGIPGAKIEILKDHCSTKKLPFRLELHSVPENDNQHLRNRKESGYFNEYGTFERIREYPETPSRPTSSGVGQFLKKVTEFMNDKSKDNQSFPHGPTASRQMREMYAPNDPSAGSPTP